MNTLVYYYSSCIMLDLIFEVAALLPCHTLLFTECPRCHQVYEHVASDCLHSVCLDKECLHEFCSGCKQPYYKPVMVSLVSNNLCSLSVAIMYN